MLALQGDVREHLRDARATAGADGRPVRRPAELAAVDAHGAPRRRVDDDASCPVFELLDPLRERLRDGMPALGSCAGMILLADRIEGGIEGQQTLGGLDVVVRRNAFGRQVDSFETDVDFDGVRRGRSTRSSSGRRGSRRSGAASRCSPPSPSGPAAGRIVAVRQGAVMATSFHPEITGDAACTATSSISVAPSGR